MFKTHILHCAKLVDRKTHIQNELIKQNINDYEFITSFDGDSLSQEIIDQYYFDNKAVCDKHSQVTLRHNKCSDSVYKKLSNSSISLCIKHIESLRSFLACGYDHLLMIEDDCSFLNEQTDINKIILNAPQNWDVLFIGGAFSYNILPIRSVINGYILADHPSTNTTSSLIYNKNSAKKTLDTIIPFSLPIDWHLNHIFHINNFKVYHTNPYLCRQLSNVTFKSTIERF